MDKNQLRAHAGRIQLLVVVEVLVFLLIDGQESVISWRSHSSPSLWPASPSNSSNSCALRLSGFPFCSQPEKNLCFLKG